MNVDGWKWCYDIYAIQRIYTYQNKRKITITHSNIYIYTGIHEIKSEKARTTKDRTTTEK